MATMKFSTGNIKNLEFTPTEEGVTGVLSIEGKMTYSVAKTLFCEGLLFDEKKKARAFANTIKLPRGLKEMEICLPNKRGDSFKSFKCDVPGLTVKHAENHDDNELHLTVSCHFDVKHQDLLDFVLDKRKAEIAWELVKRQGDLFPEEPEEKKEDDKQSKLPMATEEQKEAVAAAND